MHKHVFSVAMVMFAVGGTVFPAPPPPAVVSRVQDVLAAPLPSMPDAMRFLADARDVSPAQ